MDTSSPEYTVVHRTLDPQIKYNLVLLQKDNKYSVLYEYVTGRDHLPDRLWYDIDGLAGHGVSLAGVITYDAFVEMAAFIREYVGEARWILAVLANT